MAAGRDGLPCPPRCRGEEAFGEYQQFWHSTELDDAVTYGSAVVATLRDTVARCSLILHRKMGMLQEELNFHTSRNPSENPQIELKQRIEQTFYSGSVSEVKFSDNRRRLVGLLDGWRTLPAICFPPIYTGAPLSLSLVGA